MSLAKFFLLLWPSGRREAIAMQSSSAVSDDVDVAHPTQRRLPRVRRGNWGPSIQLDIQRERRAQLCVCLSLYPPSLIFYRCVSIELGNRNKPNHLVPFHSVRRAQHNADRLDPIKPQFDAYSNHKSISKTSSH